jgi:hypothetical protein
MECQMTIGEWAFHNQGYGKCGRTAKFRNPKPAMGVEFVCGIHARSLDTMYKRIGSKLRCQLVNQGGK